MRTLQSTALPLSYPRTLEPHRIRYPEVEMPSHPGSSYRFWAAPSLPVSLVGQDRWLSPTRPGFNSRTGKVRASRAPLAERSAVNRQVLGSIPSGGVQFCLGPYIRQELKLFWCKGGAWLRDITNPWRNGSASDSRPEGWGFKSLWVHMPPELRWQSGRLLTDRSLVRSQVVAHPFFFAVG